MRLTMLNYNTLQRGRKILNRRQTLNLINCIFLKFRIFVSIYLWNIIVWLELDMTICFVLVCFDLIFVFVFRFFRSSNQKDLKEYLFLFSKILCYLKYYNFDYTFFGLHLFIIIIHITCTRRIALCSKIPCLPSKQYFSFHWKIPKHLYWIN